MKIEIKGSNFVTFCRRLIFKVMNVLWCISSVIEEKLDNSIRCSQAVTHPSTNQTQCCLTSVIRRELVFSTWYGRCQVSWAKNIDFCGRTMHFLEKKAGNSSWKGVKSYSISLLICPRYFNYLCSNWAISYKSACFGKTFVGNRPTKVILNKKRDDNSTRCSQAVSHPSTNRAQCCLTSVIRRELVFSTWYGRCRESILKITDCCSFRNSSRQENTHSKTIRHLLFARSYQSKIPNQNEKRWQQHPVFPGGLPSKY